MDKYNFKKSGGSWLGAVRTWMQWNCNNGDSVTWGSDDELKGYNSVKRLEDAAGDAAWAAIEPFYDTKEGVRKMVLMQMNDGKPIAKILEDMYEEMCLISEQFHVDEIPMSLPEEVTALDQSVMKEIHERNGDNITLIAIWTNATGKLWKIVNKLKWKLH